MDIGYIKAIPTHAAAVHEIMASVGPLDLARVALARPEVLLPRAMNETDIPRKTNWCGLSLLSKVLSPRPKLPRASRVKASGYCAAATRPV
jgi:hypothetical protein